LVLTDELDEKAFYAYLATFCTVMQLPRGKFHSMRNDAPFQSVNADIKNEKLTGFVHLYFNEKVASVVFEKGVPLLAEIDKYTGTDGWNKVLELGDTQVKAEVYALTPAQVSLCLEFNQKCKISSTLHDGAVVPGSGIGSSSGISATTNEIRSPLALPKGTFHSLKIGTIDSVLLEISKGVMTGYGNLDIDGSKANIVFLEGVIKQAAFSSYVGKPALDRIRSQKSAEVEAELYALTPMEVQASLEEYPDHLVESVHPSSKMVKDVPSFTTPPSSDGLRPSSALQLPRGTFLSTDKVLSFKNLLDGLEKKSFTGYCRLVFEGGDGTIVLDEGICVMADIPPEWGNRALQRLQGNGDISVSAELYTLTAPQMELTREFNSAYRVRIDPGQAVLRMKPQKISEKPMKNDKNEESKTDIPSDLEEQLHAMESTDFDALTDKFKDNFKDVLKRLQLTHLMEEDDEDAKLSEDVYGDTRG
jgi:hypothetical protein